MEMMIQLTHQGGDGDSKLWVNVDHIAAITDDAPRGSRVHMGITGHQWGVIETPRQVLNLISGGMPTNTPPPPPPIQGASS